jgi:hypothetical protein
MNVPVIATMRELQPSEFCFGGSRVSVKPTISPTKTIAGSRVARMSKRESVVGAAIAAKNRPRAMTVNPTVKNATKKARPRKSSEINMVYLFTAVTTP